MNHVHLADDDRRLPLLGVDGSSPRVAHGYRARHGAVLIYVQRQLLLHSRIIDHALVVHRQ